jgi:predicted transcriptional regulator
MTKNNILIGFGIIIIIVISLLAFSNSNLPNNAGAEQPKDFFKEIQIQSEKIDLNQSKKKEQEQAIEQAQANIKTLDSQKESLYKELKDITNQCLSDSECAKKLEAGQKASKTIEI